MIDTILMYFVGICNDIVCLLNPKRKAKRKIEACSDPFDLLLATVDSELRLMALETYLFQLRRLKEIQEKIKELKEDQGEITEFRERTIYQTNEGVVIKERLIRQLKMKIEKSETLFSKKELPDNRRF